MRFRTSFAPCRCVRNASSVELALALQPLEDRHGSVARLELLARPQGITPEALVGLAPLEVVEAQLAFLSITAITDVLLNVEPAMLNSVPESQLTSLLAPVADSVALEVTERGELSSSAISVLSVFHEAGGEVWLDDFGTGDSTWEQRSALVRRGLVSGVKLPIGHDVAVARELFGEDTLVVQEGVEKEWQKLQAFKTGADLVQGWLVGRPVLHEHRMRVRLPL